MGDVQLHLNDSGHGAFVITDKNELLAEMEVGLEDQTLTVYHTEVSDKLKGQGVGSLLFNEMVNYARKHQLQVDPMCSFVHARLKKNRDEYQDIWS